MDYASVFGAPTAPPSLGPAPCDRCCHRSRCALSGEACVAFRLFYHGEDWTNAPTEPRADVGRQILGTSA